MLDILTFPHITATKPEEQVVQIKDYLFRMKEELEFALTNITVDNLSDELVAKLNSLGADIEKGNERQDEQIQQLNKITVNDVINDPAFKFVLEGMMPTFRVNFETGDLEY